MDWYVKQMQDVLDAHKRRREEETVAGVERTQPEE